MPELILDRPLPASIESERLVLGSLLAGTLSVSRARAVVAPEDFSTTPHQRIFQACCEVDGRGEPVNQVTVFEALRARGSEQSVGGLGYLVDLRSESLPINLDSYLRRIRETAVLRHAIQAAHDFIAQAVAAYDPPADLIARAERTLRELGASVQPDGKLRPVEQIIAEAPHGLDGVLMPHILDPGIPLPWPTLNRMLGGLRRGQLVVVGGRPGMGKSAFGVQVACHAVTRGKWAAFFSFEMSAEQIITRAACQQARVDSQQVRAGRLERAEREAFVKALNGIRERLLIYDAPPATVSAIAAAARRRAAAGQLHLVVVDYLQLMEAPGRRDSRVQEVSEISRSLKLLAGELGVPLLCLAQLNRSPENERRAPRLADLRDSGSIEQDADVVVFIHREQDRPDKPAEFRIAKQRDGPTGRVYVRWEPRFTRFEELTDAAEPLEVDDAA